MDIRITPFGGEAVYLDLMPEKIKAGGNAKFMTYSILALGDVKIPRGSALEEVSWSGRFPGASRIADPYVKRQYYREPEEYISLFSSWRDSGTKLRLAVIGTGINLDVYMSEFSGRFSGGHGDFDYDVKFVEAKDIVITVVRPENGSGLLPRNEPASSPVTDSGGSGSAPAVRTYTATDTDTLWRIAQQYLGSGARYMEIFNLNRSKLSDPNVLPPGTVLTLPSA